ncbi:hypothetical protein OGAPHI_006754 [Ogataea philodendri]|uniref:Oligomycin resistance ATP-dependent permease YOR1 n=1 Tax=Ogataea philodendri TaxID=1378263 RepID=A0A9P8NY51_9ASCO|nr:uncharacterized protein OGAPHI_006754 [Ogataea philodendri]KAH3661347.1 hypothetical protein OGAPHI_006754 [Ogataea philodendri]
MSVEETAGTNLALQKRSLTFLFGKKVPPLPLEEERKVFPHYHTNIIYRAFFWYLTPLMRVGYKRTLQPEDMYLLDEEQTIDYMYKKFIASVDSDLEKQKAKHILKKCKERGETPESSSVDPETDLEDFELHYVYLVKGLIRVFGWQYGWATFIKAFADLSSALLPLVLKRLINFVERKAYGLEPHVGKGIGYAFGVSLMVYFSGFAFNHFFYNSTTVGAKVKAVLTKALLEKSFTLDARGKHKFPIGKINSIMGTDLTRVDLALGFFPFLLGFPIPLIVIIVMLLVNIGVSALAGIGVFVMSIFLTGFIVRELFRLRVIANVFTDERVNLVKELLKNFKMIKMYGWENSYFKEFMDIRQKEMTTVLRMQVARNVLIAVAIWLPIVSSMVAFLVLHKIDSNRTVGDIFSSLSLFQELTTQFLMVPAALAMSTDMVIAFKRISQLLSCPDGQELATFFDTLDDPKLALQLKNASFQWFTFEDEKPEDSKSEDEPESSDQKSEKSAGSEVVKTEFPGLLNLNLSIAKGEFVVVTGSIGSGKSSLLNAFSGFMPKTSGSVAKNGSLMLCGYPWVQNATIKENIVFGEEYDQEKYDTIVKVCSLTGDFEQFSAADKTEVGERGITLSGGQKARINLARAVYSDKDIILLDDVLSAVDAKVGKSIMKDCIMGYLKNKTRVLATHQLSLIDSADKIMFLNGDGTVDYGTLDEVKSRNPEFVRLMEFSHNVDDDDEDENEPEQEKNDDFGADDDEDGRLIRAEEKAVNAISWDVYRTYIKAGSGKLGYFYPVVVVLAFSVSTFCLLFVNNWLSFWESGKFHEPGSFYEGIYIMFGFLCLIFLIVEFLFLVYFCNMAARRFNILAFKRLLHTPMSFLDTTPMGRVLNRFTKDTDAMDNEIQDQFRQFFQPLATIVGTLILCIIYLPWFAIAIPIVYALFYLISNFYLASSREIKRLEALKRSFVYSHFNESLSGMDTIKAHNSETRFLNTNAHLINDMNESYYTFIAVQRWLASNLELLASLVCLLICLLCVFRVFNISGAYTGLVLTYVVNIVGLVSFMLRSMTEVENQMNSVERLKFYAIDLQQEAAYDIPERDPEPTWPASGSISFQDVSMRYREGLPYAVKGLSLDVAGSEKIGICGRTGAGKSSVMYSLFRLAEFEGKITIDGVDISQIGLHKLRTKISIIPQDPVLFSGNVRSNLDPFNDRTDEELWSALEKAGLIDGSILEQVKKQQKTDANLHKFHLDRVVEDDGSNFSLGERQLLALARALVRGARILVLDEATSSVDYETDAKVQKTITEEFAQCTVLCIAHRLKTIVKYDRILVLDKGEIAELDTPRNLYEQNGIFRSMCDKSGIVEDDF